MKSSILDISLPISPEMAIWPGAPQIEFSWRKSMAGGARSNNSNFSMNVHAGTHVDAPLHFLADGESVDQLSLEVLLGPAFVLDFSDVEELTVSEFDKRWPRGEKIERILLKTRNSQEKKAIQKEFEKDFCALRESEVRWLLAQEIQLVGIDAPSIQYFGADPIVHKLFLERGVVIVEGLHLSQVAAGKYELFCLPLKLVGLEGAPARVILRSH